MASSSATSVIDHHPAAPPPTPCNHNNSLHASHTDAALSHLLRQLSSTSLSPPPLSRIRRSLPAPPPTISLLKHHDATIILSAASNHGSFRLADHGIPRELAISAYRQGATLLRLQKEHQSTTGRAPALRLVEDYGSACGSLVVDTADIDSLQPALTSFAGEMARVGVACAEMLLAAAGLRNPFSWGSPPRCLMWVSPPSPTTAGLGEERSGLGGRHRYPHVLCVQYQIDGGIDDGGLTEDDSGGTSTSPPRHDTVLVTVGDIAHVWSNGRFRKVLKQPCSPNSMDRAEADTGVMTLLVTLPTDSIISVLPPAGQSGDDSDDKSFGEVGEFHAKYTPFSFEEYAGRLRQEDLFSKEDPLLTYKN